MRFACHNCGKAYKLPEEKIAEKNNVKLKCRVCGTVIEVKRGGELVASLLPSEGAPPRVSEAPDPLASLAPGGPPSGASLSAPGHSLPVSPQAASPQPAEDPAPDERSRGSEGHSLSNGASGPPPLVVPGSLQVGGEMAGSGEPWRAPLGESASGQEVVDIKAPVAPGGASAPPVSAASSDGEEEEDEETAPAPAVAPVLSAAPAAEPADGVEGRRFGVWVLAAAALTGFVLGIIYCRQFM